MAVSTFAVLENMKCLRCLLMLDLNFFFVTHTWPGLQKQWVRCWLLLLLYAIVFVMCGISAAFAAPVGVSLWDSADSLLSDIQTTSSCSLNLFSPNVTTTDALAMSYKTLIIISNPWLSVLTIFWIILTEPCKFPQIDLDSSGRISAGPISEQKKF